MTILDSIQKIPTKARTYGFIGFLIVVAILFVWQIWIPKKDQIKKLEKTVSGLQATIRENDEKIRKLDDLRAEVRKLKEKLQLLTEQLPPDTEVSGLLAQIQRLITQSGLTLKLWRPDKRKTHASGLYEEIPITMDITGGYHNVGVFFDKVSKLARIVNILNVQLGGAKFEKGAQFTIQIHCTAMTFAAKEKKADVAPAAKPAR
jgi:type IV pilus assembly protein PilO